jgi:tetratricopeptide (TPR) repeat protein
MKDYEKAILFLKKCIGMNPEDQKYLYRISEVYLKYEKYNESIDYANKLIDLNPLSSKALYLKGKNKLSKITMLHLFYFYCSQCFVWFTRLRTVVKTSI